MPQPVVILDTSTIRPGSLGEVKTRMTELAAFVEANEPRAIAYDVYLDADSGSVTVLQIHTDSSSAELHMDIAADMFRPFAQLLDLQRIDVFGAPSEELLSRLRAKGKLLGSEELSVHDFHAGFVRHQTAASSV